MKKINDNKELNKIGKKIAEARNAAGISQEQLSEKLELLAVYICRGSISRIEHGKRTVNDIELDGISKVLNVSPDFFFSCESEIE